MARTQAGGSESGRALTLRRQWRDDSAPTRGIGFAIGLVLRTVTPLILLSVIAAGIVYVRLLNGPISLRWLTGPIAASLSAELGGYSVRIEDAIVRLTPDGTTEFRLRGVRLADPDNQPVAVAPLASMSLSYPALASAKLAPERIVLIEPRLLLVTDEPSPPPAPGQAAGAPTAIRIAPPAPSPAAGRGGSPTGAGEQQVRLDVIKLASKALAEARRTGDTSTFLKEIGVKQGTLIVDHASGQSVWRLIDADIDLDHRKKRSVLEAKALIASDRGPWRLAVHIEDSEKDQAFNIRLAINDLNPSALARAARVLPALSALDAPVSGQIVAGLSTDGRLTGTKADLTLGAGALLIDPGGRQGLGFESGRVSVAVGADLARIDVPRAEFVGGGGRIELTGFAAQEAGEAPFRPWRFEAHSLAGSLSSADGSGQQLAIESFHAEGRASPLTGSVELKQAVLQVDRSSAVLTGLVAGQAAPGPSRLDVRLSAMPLATLKAIWPSAVAADARRWIGTNATRGRLGSGFIHWETSPPHQGSGPQLLTRLSMAIELADAEFVPLPGFPPVEASRVLVRVEGQVMEVSIPDASMTVGPQRRLQFKGSRVDVADIFADYPMAQIAFRATGPAGAAFALLQRDPISLGQKLGINLDAAEGKLDSALKFTLPFDQNIRFRDVQIEGQARITEGKGKGLLGGYDVQAATVQLDLTEEALQVRGDLLVQGISAKLSGQHLMRATSEQQPPIRLTATLDPTDRRALGINLGQILQGDLPIEVVVQRRANGELAQSVRADLTNADVALDMFGWRKPPGRAAQLQFELARGTRHRTELQNVKIVGDTIAAEGWMALDDKNRLKEFEFPDFTLNLVSQLVVKGSLRDDGVWEVRARGSRFDGRDLFRSLFSVGQLREPSGQAAAQGEARDTPGADVRAEIDNVIGFFETPVRNVRLQLSRRQGRLVALELNGLLNAGRSLGGQLRPGDRGQRLLEVRSDDAGQVLRLVGLYPNVQGGRLRLNVNLDGSGAATTTGQLEIDQFQLLGETVMSEPFQMREDGTAGPAAATAEKPRLVRQLIPFDSMRAPFAVGHGQLVLEHADLRGPLFGANVRGKVDLRTQTVNMAGTYAPLQGLNAAIGIIPGIGEILTGPRGEGVLAIKFAIQGPLAQPQFLVNPLSLLTPGFLREITEISNPSTQVTPTPQPPPAPRGDGRPRASSAPVAQQPARGGSAQPEIKGGWSSQTQPGGPRLTPARPARQPATETPRAATP